MESAEICTPFACPGNCSMQIAVCVYIFSFVTKENGYFITSPLYNSYVFLFSFSSSSSSTGREVGSFKLYANNCPTAIFTHFELNLFMCSFIL